MSYPQYKPDFYSSSFIKDSMPHYKRIRDLGPAVWLPKHKLWAVSRYEDVKTALLRNNVLISGKGIAANRFANSAMTKENTITLTADGQDHLRRRKVVGKPLTKKGISVLQEQIQAEANSLVDNLTARKSFDGVKDFAEHLPVHIVSNLLGIPEIGRKNMLNWSTQAFNTSGPLNFRTLKSIPAGIQLLGYGYKLKRENINPNGWVSNLYKAADDGTLDEKEVPAMVNDYMGPALDTTVIASTYMLKLLGENPDVWECLQANTGLITSTVYESLRLASPVRGWCRYASEEVEIGGTVLPEGSRVLVILASANYDERKWQSPESFDINRNPRDHAAFGFGAHSCLGRHLAQLEMESLLRAMVERVSRIEVGKAKLALNNTLRGFSSLPVKFY